MKLQGVRLRRRRCTGSDTSRSAFHTHRPLQRCWWLDIVIKLVRALYLNRASVVSMRSEQSPCYILNYKHRLSFHSA